MNKENKIGSESHSDSQSDFSTDSEQKDSPAFKPDEIQTSELKSFEETGEVKVQNEEIIGTGNKYGSVKSESGSCQFEKKEFFKTAFFAVLGTLFLGSVSWVLLIWLIFD